MLFAGASLSSFSSHSHSTLKQRNGETYTPDSATGVSKLPKTEDRLFQPNGNEEDSSASRNTAELLHVSSSDSDGPNKRYVGLRSHDRRAQPRDQRVPNANSAEPENLLFKVDGDTLQGKLPLKSTSIAKLQKNKIIQTGRSFARKWLLLPGCRRS